MNWNLWGLWRAVIGHLPGAIFDGYSQCPRCGSWREVPPDIKELFE